MKEDSHVTGPNDRSVDRQSRSRFRSDRIDYQLPYSLRVTRDTIIIGVTNCYQHYNSHSFSVYLVEPVNRDSC